MRLRLISSNRVVGKNTPSADQNIIDYHATPQTDKQTYFHCIDNSRQHNTNIEDSHFCFSLFLSFLIYSRNEKNSFQLLEKIRFGKIVSHCRPRWSREFFEEIFIKTSTLTSSLPTFDYIVNKKFNFAAITSSDDCNSRRQLTDPGAFGCVLDLSKQSRCVFNWNCEGEKEKKFAKKKQSRQKFCDLKLVEDYVPCLLINIWLVWPNGSWNCFQRQR